MDRRTAESVLFAIKRMLLSWEYTNKEVHVDTEMGILKVAGQEVVKAEVKDFILKVNWCSGEWEQWEDLQGAPELAELKNTAQGKLDRAKTFSAGGKGKKGKGE